MSKTEFTPGPWTTRRNAEIDKIINIHDRRNDPIANVASGFVWMPREEGEANANLISAAPDMHKALSEILTAVALIDAPLDKNILTIITLCERAIVKAGG